MAQSNTDKSCLLITNIFLRVGINCYGEYLLLKKITLKSFIDNKATKGPAMYFNGCTLTVLLDFAVQCRRTLMVDPTRSDGGGLRYSVKSVHFCPRKRPLPGASLQ